MRKNPEFKKIWEYIGTNTDWDIRLKVSPGLKNSTGNEVYGGFSRGLLELNPTKPEPRANPLELLDTLIHESIHAAIIIHEETEATGYPLKKNVLDIGSNRILKQGKITPYTGMNKGDIALDAALKTYAEKNYGDYSPPDKPPRTTYVDVNIEAQKIIVSILQDILKDPSIKSIAAMIPTTTFDNVKLLEKRQQQ